MCGIFGCVLKSGRAAPLINEGLQKLSEISHYKGDNGLITSCKRLLNFYITEAEEKIPVIAEFIVTKEEHDKMVKLIESKDRMMVSSEEIQQYNNAVTKYNGSINKVNTTNQYLNNKRNANLEYWNNSVENFMNRHIPKK